MRIEVDNRSSLTDVEALKMIENLIEEDKKEPKYNYYKAVYNKRYFQVESLKMETKYKFLIADSREVYNDD